MTDDNENEDRGSMWDRNKKGTAALTVSGRSSMRDGQMILTGEAIKGIGAVVRAGETVEADAQRVLLTLASFGEGDRRGRYAFTSAEMCGVEQVRDADLSGPPDALGYLIWGHADWRATVPHGNAVQVGGYV